MALACRFRIRLIHSQWRITPRPADSTRTILRLRSVLRLPGPDSRPACVTQLWKRGCVPTRLQPHNYEFTGGLKGNLGEFGDYFKTWNWESGFRYNEDSRIERFGGNVDNSALRAALLDTNPATAFNPFGLNQNSPAVINKIFVTTHRLGMASLMLEDLKLYGDLWNLPAGPIAFAIGGEHRTEHEKDQPDSLIASRSNNWPD